MSTGLRLRDERKRLGLTQRALGALGGVRVQAQLRYEHNERYPDAAYLAALAAHGVDIQYVITGKRSNPVQSDTPTLSSDESQLLATYRQLSDSSQKALMTLCNEISKGSLGKVSSEH